MNIEKYIFKIVEIIYQGLDGRITQRQIRIFSIKDGIVKAHCLQSNGPRTFRLENILIVQQVIRYAS